MPPFPFTRARHRLPRGNIARVQHEVREPQPDERGAVPPERLERAEAGARRVPGRFHAGTGGDEHERGQVRPALRDVNEVFVEDGELGVEREGERELAHVVQTEEGCAGVREAQGGSQGGCELAREVLECGEMPSPDRAGGMEVREGDVAVAMNGEACEGWGDEAGV